MKTFYNTEKKKIVVSRLVKWPSYAEDIVKEFRKIASFLGIIGAIEATYAKASPPIDQHNVYLDWTMKHSVILLADVMLKKLHLYSNRTCR